MSERTGETRDAAGLLRGHRERLKGQAREIRDQVEDLAAAGRKGALTDAERNTTRRLGDVGRILESAEELAGREPKGPQPERGEGDKRDEAGST